MQGQTSTYTGPHATNHQCGTCRIGDVPQRSGATGIDMGGGGEGTDVEPETTLPRRQAGSRPQDK